LTDLPRGKWLRLRPELDVTVSVWDGVDWRDVKWRDGDLGVRPRLAVCRRCDDDNGLRGRRGLLDGFDNGLVELSDEISDGSWLWTCPAFVRAHA
jgi:hypothetical protein